MWCIMWCWAKNKKKNSNNNRKETNFLCIAYGAFRSILKVLRYSIFSLSERSVAQFIESKWFVFLFVFTFQMYISSILRFAAVSIWFMSLFCFFFLSEFKNTNARMSFEVSNISIEYGIVMCECVWHSNF